MRLGRTVIRALFLTAGTLPIATFLATYDHPLAAAASQQSALPVQQQPGSGSPVPAGSPQRAVFDKYCIACHNQRLRVGGLALDALDLSRVSANGEIWEKVIRRLRTQTMPPAGRPRPDERTYSSVASWLEGQLDTEAAARPDPGRTETFHRLNRFEYHNVVRDLLAIDIDVAALLPPDDTFASGFDNNATVLSISPTQMEHYLSAAKKISRLVVGIPPVGPAVSSYKNHLNLIQEDRMGEDLPFASRGGIAVRHYFPVDGEYSVKVKLQENYNDYIRGMGTKQQLDVRVDGVLIKRFSVGGEATGKPAPLSFGANILGDPAWEWYMHSADAGLEVRFPAKAGPRTISASFVRSAGFDEGVVQPRQTSYALAINEMYDGRAAVDNIAVGGPYTVAGPGDTPGRRAVLSCKPARASEEESCAKKILSALATRAYRRPVADQDVQTLLGFYRSGRRDGNFDAGIQFALQRLLVDPDFLLRIERDPAKLAPGSVYQLGDLDLASRLSFFLWSSIPDDHLLDVAARGKLNDPVELDRQIRRMLADPRSASLVENFAAQWLNLRILDGVFPDPDLFPEFDENLRQSFRRETELFIESTLREDRSVMDLLSANYTFVNERLAKHYGIPDVYGGHFRRVTFGPDDPRGGLLGQGALLTVTSYPTRTSIVLRGKWLLENIVGTIPPEPPPDVPSLPERGEGGEARSVRELMETHRKNPVCASCHMQMDPLGFALENFDAIGTWRSESAGRPLDVSGELPSGAHFEGAPGLRRLLVSQRSLFTGTITEKLLSYALGRGLEHYDHPTVRKIVRDSAASDHRWSSIIQGIVKSAPFRTRRALAPESTAAAVPQ